MVMATMTVHYFNLVVPLAHKATAMRIRGTAGNCQAAPRAVSVLIGEFLRHSDVDSTTQRVGL